MVIRCELSLSLVFPSSLEAIFASPSLHGRVNVSALDGELFVLGRNLCRIAFQNDSNRKASQYIMRMKTFFFFCVCVIFTSPLVCDVLLLQPRVTGCIIILFAVLLLCSNLFLHKKRRTYFCHSVSGSQRQVERVALTAPSPRQESHSCVCGEAPVGPPAGRVTCSLPDQCARVQRILHESCQASPPSGNV